MKSCYCSSEIKRDGSSQIARYLIALDPSYAKIDGRSIEELLVFAKRYAAQIRFYDIPESKIEDGTYPAKISWKEFFRRDMAVIAASIATIDLQQIKKDYDETRLRLNSDPDPGVFAALFKPVLGMAVRIDHWYSIAIPDNPLKRDLELVVNSVLKPQIKKVLAYEEGFKLVSPKTPLKLEYSEIENEDFWGLNDIIEPDASIYNGSNTEDKIITGGLYVDEIFDSFYGCLQQFVDQSESYLKFALEEYPAHQPHMALFITFLQLFQLMQEQMNGLTARMLDFYYNDVLHLAPQPSIPDKVHIVFDLAKGVTEYNILKGTGLKAGKDSIGKEHIYKTESDLVVNQAKVKELKTIFIEKKPKEGPEEDKTITGFFARPVANSLDGQGAKFEVPNSKWPTFGKGLPDVKGTKNICQAINLLSDLSHRQDQTSIGFAIASPQLLLQGGKRLLEFQTSSIAVLAEKAKEIEEISGNLFEIWLSGEKGWLKINKVMSEGDKSEFTKHLSLGLFNSQMKIESSYYINQNSLSLYLSPNDQAIVRFDPAIHPGYDYKTSYPICQIRINPLLSLKALEFHGFRITDFSIRVKVGSISPSQKDSDVGIFPQNATDYHFDGLKQVILQNDDGVIPSDKPFNPFTAFPIPGKSFYVGSEEIFNKPLGRLSVNIKKTMDDGGNLSENSQSGREYKVSVLHGRSWTRLITEVGTDFFRRELTANILNGPATQANGVPTPLSLGRTPILPVTQWKSNTEKGFLRISNLIALPAGNQGVLVASQNMAPYLEIKEVSLSYESHLYNLENGIDQFFHIYPFGVVETYIEQRRAQKVPPRWGALFMQDEFSKIDKVKEQLLVNAGNSLFPQFTYLSPYAEYQESTVKKVEENIEKLNPAGTVESYPTLNPNKVLDNKQVIKKMILNQSGLKRRITGSPNQYSNLFQEEGMLFIGLEKAKPLQVVSFLFQFAEGSAEDEDNDPPSLHWSYLSYNEWRPFKGESIIHDGTFGFQTTGIVKIEIPEDASNVNTIITNGLHWICVSVTENANRIPQLIDVVTQAVEAKFQDNNNAPSHFDSALPSGTIGKLEVAVAEVSSVKQPFASYDGKPKEIGKEFYTRSSERLRHKGRAINAWDYEHLILNRFPNIYKVKCIPHTDPNCLCRTHELKNTPATAAAAPARDTNEVLELLLEDVLSSGERKIDTICCGAQIAPGHVLVIPVANLKNRNAANPLQPKTSRRTLLEIEAYIKKRTSPFVKIHAKNPVYEEIIVAFRVQFYSGNDKGYYMKKLNEEIVHYLTPWAFDEQAEVTFGQKIYASSIINFIEERPYVDFITDFLMGVCEDACCDDHSLKEDRGDGNKESYSDDSSSDSKNEVAETLESICGCDEFEYLLQDNTNFKGQVVAKPSGPRSILVSVPQHIIIPYEPPKKLAPCEEVKRDKSPHTPLNPSTRKKRDNKKPNN